MNHQTFSSQLDQAFNHTTSLEDTTRVVGHGALLSPFAVTELATATVAAAGREVTELIADAGGDRPEVIVDRRITSYWFVRSVQPVGWELPPTWDAVAGDYRTRDGWIKLHTNAPHHRAAALRVLGTEADRNQVAGAVSRWDADDLETAIVEAGGCAAQFRSTAQWRVHRQGAEVRHEPLVARHDGDIGPSLSWSPTATRPLAGIRVLDLTRVLAGPVATRFLAGYGADVLRLDPPDWDEPSLAPDVTVGKRCARLDLRTDAGRHRFEQLLADADVLVHGYRPDALEHLGLGSERRREIRPALIDVSLCAYGWTGPWRHRRGFDSLVQLSSGIAHEAMILAGADAPISLPAQALDHATGYLLAASAIHGLRDRLHTDRGSEWRLSLARTAWMLLDGPRNPTADDLAPLKRTDFDDNIEPTAWGPQRRLRPPLHIPGTPHYWDRPAGPLGATTPTWLS